MQELMNTFNLIRVEEYSVWFGVVSIIISILALSISASTKRSMEAAHDYETDWKMREKAQSFSVSQNEERRKAREILENSYDKLHHARIDFSVKPYTLDEVLSKFAEDSNTPEEAIETACKVHGIDPVRLSLDLMLGNYENLALAIYSRIADPKTAYQLVGPTFMYYAHVFQEYIIFKNENKLRRFSYLIELAAVWLNYPENAKFTATKFRDRAPNRDREYFRLNVRGSSKNDKIGSRAKNK